MSFLSHLLDISITLTIIFFITNLKLSLNYIIILIRNSRRTMYRISFHGGH